MAPVPSNLIDIVWNITALCPWDCAVCCVSALHVRQRSGKVLVSNSHLGPGIELERDNRFASIYDQALAFRQARGLELSLEQKVQVLENFGDLPVKLDIAGGDPLAPSENLVFLRIASERLGRDALTLSATGAGLARCAVDEVASYVCELNFSFDGKPRSQRALRSETYSSSNLRRAKAYSAAGVSVRAECPLSTQNVDADDLTRLYLQLHEAGVDKLLVMRLFPVGRGKDFLSDTPSPDEYRRAVQVLRALEEKYETPSVTLQCALKHIEGASQSNPCDAVSRSLGLTWNGTLLASPWATQRDGNPLANDWVLGDLTDSTLPQLLRSERANVIRQRADENYGHCKILSYLNGGASVHSERMFEPTDPLYATQ